jgi:catechol 2,3-dioxygenase-like lactoylglutathione lyase family enzyme
VDDKPTYAFRDRKLLTIVPASGSVTGRNFRGALLDGHWVVGSKSSRHAVSSQSNKHSQVRAHDTDESTTPQHQRFIESRSLKIASISAKVKHKVVIQQLLHIHTNMSNVDFDNPGTAVKSPSKLAHVVLRTSDIKTMVQFYTTFLGASVIHENSMLAFLSYDEEHHRIAIAQIPGTQSKVKKSCGLEHIAFTFDSLTDLMLAYRQRKQSGIMPKWCVNHGPTTSLYYQDPDGNQLETQVDNYEDPHDATKFMASKEFMENPIGVDFDPEEMIERLQRGESDESLRKRADIGPRGLPDFMLG